MAQQNYIYEEFYVFLASDIKLLKGGILKNDRNKNNIR